MTVVLEVLSDYCCDLTQFNYFQIESQNFQIKSQIESQCFKSNLFISNRITKMVQIVI